MRARDTILSFILATFALALLSLTVTPAAAAKAPIGKTYFVISIGVATDDLEAYEVDAGCLVFTRDELCDDSGGGDCGPWWLAEDDKQSRKQMSFEFKFDLIDDETGTPIEMDGKGRIETRGPKSSIAAAARAIEPSSGTQINFALAGRSVRPAKCARLVEQFEEGNAS